MPYCKIYDPYSNEEKVLNIDQYDDYKKEEVVMLTDNNGDVQIFTDEKQVKVMFNYMNKWVIRFI